MLTCFMFNLFESKYLQYVWLANAIVFLAAAVIGAVKFIYQLEPVVLRLDFYTRRDWLGNRWDVFELLLLSLAMLFFNFFLADFLYRRERFLSYIFSFVSLFLSLIVLAIIVVIKMNNGG